MEVVQEYHWISASGNVPRSVDQITRVSPVDPGGESPVTNGGEAMAIFSKFLLGGFTHESPEKSLLIMGYINPYCTEMLVDG